jgi:hypothetical protein
VVLPALLSSAGDVAAGEAAASLGGGTSEVLVPHAASRESARRSAKVRMMSAKIMMLAEGQGLFTVVLSVRTGISGGMAALRLAYVE